MLLTEYNEAETMQLFKEEGRKEGKEEGRKEGKEEGRKEGRKEGENQLGQLMSLLLKQGKVAEAGKAASDPEYRNQLYEEYMIL